MQRKISAAEILIIVGLTAVVVLVAIPHFGAARRATSESILAASMVSYADAQEVFRLHNMAASIDAGQTGYCPDFALLGGRRALTVDGKPLTLIPDAMADATAEAPFMGYYFTNDPHVADWSKRFGLYARPANYGKPDVAMLYIGNSRTVWMKDPGPSRELLPVDNTWTSR